ncbi:hypothetical protein FG386_003052 [Cryptosporidium ryanae]|uniref:uncharacterized protein n=1 Tax=Cryptosporidium ryanae TaxID=515981 RepID=UPI00351A89CF|nr:hypothetical protein FG386_003052 [Cryptosporidium ryanae]
MNICVLFYSGVLHLYLRLTSGGASGGISKYLCCCGGGDNDGDSQGYPYSISGPTGLKSTNGQELVDLSDAKGRLGNGGGSDPVPVSVRDSIFGEDQGQSNESPRPPSLYDNVNENGGSRPETPDGGTKSPFSEGNSPPPLPPKAMRGAKTGSGPGPGPGSVAKRKRAPNPKPGPFPSNIPGIY